MNSKQTNIIKQNKDILSVFVATGLILLIPLLGNWPWTLFDFIAMGTLLVFTGLLLVLAKRKVKKINQRIIIGTAIVVVFLLTWVHLAVGIVDTWPFAGS